MLYEPGKTCEICGEREVFSSCEMCKAGMCQACHTVVEEICINCYDTRCQVCREYLSSRACNICGKLVCEDHGKRVNESTICDSCRKSDL